MADDPSDPRAFYLRTRDDLYATKVQGNKGDGGDANEIGGRADVMDSEVRGCVTWSGNAPSSVHAVVCALTAVASTSPASRVLANSRTQPRYKPSNIFISELTRRVTTYVTHYTI
jgi:hypothetical protein